MSDKRRRHVENRKRREPARMRRKNRLRREKKQKQRQVVLSSRLSFPFPRDATTPVLVGPAADDHRLLAMMRGASSRSRDYSEVFWASTRFESRTGSR